jgi:hypothetical protein
MILLTAFCQGLSGTICERGHKDINNMALKALCFSIVVF